MKKYLIGFILAAILAAAAIWWFRREPTLVELQKQYLFAKTEAEREKVIDRLEQYYLNLPVPDSLRQRVDREVTTILDTTKIHPTAYANGAVTDSNVYQLEGKLQDLLRLAAIARAREENQTFQELIGRAEEMAKTVDAGTQMDYWVSFVEEVNAFDKEKAVFWLKARRAEGLCRRFQDSESKFEDAERYGSLGLNFLERAYDWRIQLDIMQRLQFILYEHRSMYELSVALGHKILSPANNIKYYLRLNGIFYHQAQALARMGQNQAAIAPYDAVINNAEKFRKIADMKFYAIHGLLGKSQVYLELGEFEEAVEACKEVEIQELEPRDRIRLQVLKGYIYTSKGNYEQAEEELQKARALAEAKRDVVNLIWCLNNFGVMFERLTEYDLALDYYNQAQSLFTTSSPEISLRLLILNNIADVLATKNEFVEFEKINQEATRLVKIANMPSRAAQLNRNIGNMYKKAGKYSEALKYFLEAAAIFNKNGFFRLDLGAKIDLVDCLIELSSFDEAEALISEIELLAKEINDIERVIDAVGRLAKIHYQKGKAAKAVEISNRLLKEIEALSSSFTNADLLMAYRQKIYNLLKDAVLYERVFRGQDSAFVMLDYAKAYALKSQLLNRRGNNSNQASPGKYLNLNSVIANFHEKSIVMDYMVTKDTLYTFVLDQKGLQFMFKSIKMEDFKKTVNAYKDSINRTIQIFQHYDANKVNLHYAGTVKIGQKLYDYLFRWPELEIRLQTAELLYIIPDEFLYEVPFATLIAKSSDAQTFIANHAAVAILPSTGFLQFKNAAHVANQLTSKRVLISADQRLPGSKEFVAKVKARFPLTEEIKVDNITFTKDDVLAKLQEDYQIYIFIGHGSGNPKYPERSYIELSVKTPNTSTSKIVQLSMSDLKEMKWLNTEMVMLVGCETASGKLYRGTGIAGLHQGFLSLGAQNVLGNLWEVDANHAISQAEEFLASWVATRDPSQALRECQLKAIQELQGHNYYKQPHPYFWGSSILLTAKPQ